jgi:hypothetical protein
MGNYCDNNFENIRENEVVISHVSGPGRLSNSRHSDAKASSQLTPHKPIDQEVIHSIFKRQDPVVEVVEEDESKVHFPAAEVISITTEKPQKVRHKLEELDLSFYHSLALPDYEYQSIPENDL